MLKVVVSEPTSTRIDVDNPQQLEDVVRRLHNLGITDSEVHIEHLRAPAGEVTDADMARSIRLGALVGVPVVYLLSGIIALLAGVPLREASQIGLIPAAFGGWFVAGFVFLNARSAAIETARHTVAVKEIDEIVVTGSHATMAAGIAEEVAAAA